MNNHTLGEGSKEFIVLLYQICETDRNAIDQMYRDGSFIGDGGTASILKFEKRTGLNTGRNGNSHYQKAVDSERYLSNKVLKENLTFGERRVAEKMVRSLKKSMIEWRS